MKVCVCGWVYFPACVFLCMCVDHGMRFKGQPWENKPLASVGLLLGIH